MFSNASQAKNSEIYQLASVIQQYNRTVSSEERLSVRLLTGNLYKSRIGSEEPGTSLKPQGWNYQIETLNYLHEITSKNA